MCFPPHSHTSGFFRHITFVSSFFTSTIKKVTKYKFERFLFAIHSWYRKIKLNGKIKLKYKNAVILNEIKNFKLFPLGHVLIANICNRMHPTALSQMNDGWRWLRQREWMHLFYLHLYLRWNIWTRLTPKHRLKPEKIVRRLENESKFFIEIAWGRSLCIFGTNEDERRVQWCWTKISYSLNAHLHNVYK